MLWTRGKGRKNDAYYAVELRYLYVVGDLDGGVVGGQMVLWFYYYTVTVRFLVDDDNNGDLGAAPYDFCNFE